MRKIFFIIISIISLNVLSLNASLRYDIKKFGAKGDGVTLDTRSIQKAIDEAYKNGGGCIEIPAGTYKIGTLILKDNIHLHIQAGGVLMGSPDYRDYTAVSQTFESRTKGLYAKYFMIFAENAKNISITGPGIIYGNGDKNFKTVRPQNLRPFMIRLVNCRNVTIKDVRLLESANWTLHLLGCKGINVDGIVIRTTGKGNRDGLDIDACQQMTVSNSRISTTDDAIVMKATCDTLCRDITITNCILQSEASAIKTGTESNGGFKNITISNCVIKNIPVHTGIELMTVDGGVMQNILVENIAMENVATPFFIRLGIRLRPYKKDQYVNKVNDVKDIFLNNISVINAKLPSSIMGLHNKKIKNIVVTNYSVRYSETQKAVPYNKVPLKEFSYPAANAFKNLPAYGLYCRNVDDLHLENIIMHSAANETRPALAFDRINNLELFDVKAGVKEQSAPVAHFRYSKNIFVSQCRSLGFSHYLFEMEDSTCSNFIFTNNVLQADQKETETVESLPDEYVFYEFQTDTKYSVDQGQKIKGLPAHDLSRNSLTVKFDVPKNKSIQLCLLMLDDSLKPEKVRVKYDGIVQEFLVNWNDWGWAPVTLIRQYDTDRKVKFEILPGERNSHLKIAKVYVRYQNIVFTD